MGRVIRNQRKGRGSIFSECDRKSFQHEISRLRTPSSEEETQGDHWKNHTDSQGDWSADIEFFSTLQRPTPA